MANEHFSAHPDELQIWALRIRLPLGRRLRLWLGYLAGLVIRSFTLRYGGRYSHLLLRLGGTIWEASASGVREGQAEEYHDPAYALDVFRAPLSGEQRERILAWVRGSIGVPYDWAQLVRIALAELGQDPDRFFIPDFGEDRFICSEFVAVAHRQAGIGLTGDTPLWRWTPDHVRQAARQGLLESRGQLAWAQEVAPSLAALPCPAASPA